ncbi:MAG: hypothetical protein ACR2N3_17800 [Pyrinomonadaceae bacterium]
MPKAVEVKYSRFDGGISDSPRDNQGNVFQFAKNFNIYKDKQKLAPVRGWIGDETFGTPTGIRAYNLKAISYGGMGRINAIGTKADGTGSKYFSKIDPLSTSWTEEKDFNTTPAPLESTYQAVPGFVIFKDNYLWHILYQSGFYYIARIDYNIPPVVYTPNYKLLNVTANGSPIPSAVVFGDNKIYVSDVNNLYAISSNGTIAANALTLPSNYVITSMANYNHYIAIAAYTTNPTTTSAIFLWDGSAPTFNFSINLGEGTVKVIENINGTLISVIDKYISGTLGNLQASMIIKALNQFGQTAETLKEVYVQTGSISQYKAVKGGSLLFYASLDGNSGIWSFGRKDSNSQYALTLLTETPGTSFNGFYRIGEFLYTAHSGNGSISRTNNNPVYDQSSVWQSQIIGEAERQHQAIGAVITFEPLTSGQSVTLEYRKDGGAWTAVATQNTVGSLSFPSLNFNCIFREIELRVTSQGASITGVKFRYSELTDSIS